MRSAPRTPPVTAPGRVHDAWSGYAANYFARRVAAANAANRQTAEACSAFAAMKITPIACSGVLLAEAHHLDGSLPGDAWLTPHGRATVEKRPG
jgi:hypothetical protein